MKRILRNRPSPAMVIACIALAVALGGTSYAAVTLPANSVGTKQLKKNAVTSPKVKNNALKGADILESSLGQVPSAASATNATNAANAATVGGRHVQCPAGTVEHVGFCFETALRAATNVFTASDTCKTAGGFLGDGATLRSGRGGLPLTLAAAGEWTDQIFSPDNTNFYAMTIENTGGFDRITTLSLRQYRCGFDLVRGVGASPGAALQSPAQNPDGS